MTHRQTYTQPKLTKLGTVADLTHAGHGDSKGGSEDATQVASNIASGQ
jgi:hypothetical protein